MMYNFQQTETEMRWQPHSKVSKWTYALAAFAVLGNIAVILLPIFRYEIKQTALAIGPVIFLWCLYDIFFRTRHTVIFDHKKKTVYKKYAGMFKIKLLRYQDVCVMNTQECGGDHYGISHRTNRYGKTYAISDDFGNDAEMQQFELEIIPEVEKALVI